MGRGGAAAGLRRHRAHQLELLETYQPVTWFSAAELFTPTNVGTFEGNVRLRWQNAAGSFTSAAPGSAHPSPEEIATARSSQCQAGLRDPCWILDESNCAASGGVAPATLACYQNAWQAAGPKRVLYGRVFRSRAGWALQYWYFYYDHEFEPLLATPGTATYAVQHEGDWESITVVLPTRPHAPLGRAQRALPGVAARVERGAPHRSSPRRPRSPAGAMRPGSETARGASRGRPTASRSPRTQPSTADA